MGIISNLLGADDIARSNRQLENAILESNRELGQTLKNISDSELKSKDRVNISLHEYEDMKDKISSLSYEVNRLRDILEQIEAPLDKKIVPGSIRTYWTDDYSCFNFRRKFRVEFEIERCDLR